MTDPTPSNTKKRRRRWRLVVILAAAVVVYLAVIAMYASGSRVVSSSSDQPLPQAGGVTVILTPQSVNAALESITFAVKIDPSEQLVSDPNTVGLSTAVNVIVTPAAGAQTLVYAADAIPGSQNVSVLSPGAIETWPFDRYNSTVAVLAYTLVNGVETPIPTYVYMNGYVTGWDFAVSTVELPDSSVTLADGTTTTVPAIAITASRSISTLAFAIVLLGLLIVMPTLVLFVAITAFRGKRKVEASFMSWMGAMLFATIPLRSFLPGSPPIGSWIDFLIVLWVIAGLVSGLAIYIAAWMRWGSPASGFSEAAPDDDASARTAKDRSDA